MCRLLIFLTIIMAVAVPVQAEEFLYNGDFDELDPNGAPVGWYVNYQPDTTPNWTTWDNAGDADSYNGTNFAKMWIGEEWPGMTMEQYITDITPGEMDVWSFSCVAAASEWHDWGDFIVSIDWYEPNAIDPEGPLVLSSYEEIYFWENNITMPLTNGDWYGYSHDFTVDPDAVAANIIVRGSDWADLFIDNCSMIYVDTTQAQLVFPAGGQEVSWEDQGNCGNGPTLSWISAADAIGDHHVYLGADENAVANATASDPEYKGVVPLAAPEYVVALADIQKGGTYYWRVDETTAGGVITGYTIGSFWASNQTYVDAFDYALDAELKAVWGPNAALVDNEVLEISYDHTASPYLTEAEAAVVDLGICTGNWISGGEELLLLDVKGHDGMVDSVYVILESNSGAQSGTVQYPDVAELNQQSEEWSRFWAIKLQDFTDQGVDLTNVTKVILGVGTQGAPAAGGSGAVQFDSLRLSLPMCITSLMPHDINNDCSVTLEDFAILASDWQDASYTVSASAPAVGPILWYEFNEGVGNTPTDSSGNGYTGLVSDPNGAWGGTGTGYDGTDCFAPNNTAWIEVPIAAVNDGNSLGTESTVSLWMKDPGQSDSDSQFFVFGSSDTLEVWAGSTGAFSYSAGYNSGLGYGDTLQVGQNNYTNPDHTQDVWVHYAFVKDFAGGYTRIYRDGALIAEGDSVADESPGIDGSESFASIGAWRWSAGTGGYCDGLLDDFRVYDYALSDAEVLSLAAQGGTATSPLSQDVISPADIVVDNIVDISDLAALVAYWLQDPAVYPY